MAGGAVKKPFFVVEGNDVHYYPDLDSVGAGLEAYDLGAYKLFSSDGELLRLEKRGRGIRASSEVEGEDPGALAKALYAALTSPTREGLFGRRRRIYADAEQLEGSTLAELVQTFVRTKANKPRG